MTALVALLALVALALTVAAFVGGDQADAAPAAASSTAAASSPAATGAPGPIDGVDRLGQVHASVVGYTERRLRSSGRNRSLGRRLERAGSRFRPAEWVVLVAGLTVTGAIVGGVLLGPGGVVLGVVAVVFGNHLWTGRATSRRQQAFARQLPDMLGLLSSGMRAGQGLVAALDNVADEAEAPMSEELTRVLAEHRLGRDLTEALRAMAERVGGRDIAWVVGAMEINREVGGDLSGVLDQVADTIRDRERVRGQIKALSAEGRLSAYILCALPPLVLVLFRLINPGYVSELTGTFVGWALLGLATFLLVVGTAWLRRLVRFSY
ncbi:MAG: type II secretion system F family protein [Actinomycetota bacterium]|nr:type II secretion system F family protein [Actinomycetota bacterium]